MCHNFFNIIKTNHSSTKSPKVTHLNETRPKVTCQKVIRQKVICLKVTRPKVTRPKVTRQKVTCPKVTRPKVTRPKVTCLRVTCPKMIHPKVNTWSEKEKDSIWNSLLLVMISKVLKHIFDLCSTKPFFFGQSHFPLYKYGEQWKGKGFYETVVTETVTVIATITGPSLLWSISVNSWLS